MKPEDFVDTKPTLVLEEYFEGRTKAWGIFQDRFGRLRRQFVVDIEGTWDGETLTLVEDFVYDDGELDQRIWIVRKTGPNSYEGTANDVVGVAKGGTVGRAFHWAYDLEISINGSPWVVHLDDWMLLQDEEILINKATMSKWGIRLGEITIAFRKPAEQAASISEPSSLAAE